MKLLGPEYNWLVDQRFPGHSLGNQSLPGHQQNEQSIRLHHFDTNITRYMQAGDNTVVVHLAPEAYAIIGVS